MNPGIKFILDQVSVILSPNYKNYKIGQFKFANFQMAKVSRNGIEIEKSLPGMKFNKVNR